ncbi:hypothetical protein RA269_28050 [Pseudomonas syringae pv. tagetis]|uniref:hypothetical protein n=1 Tax=Pseudomonas syringae group genomosp. 7 TaxID=251699 RepID=UPI00376F6667
MVDVVLGLWLLVLGVGAGFNCFGIIDAEGPILGNYRKNHKPGGPAYPSKY